MNMSFFWSVFFLFHKTQNVQLHVPITRLTALLAKQYSFFTENSFSSFFPSIPLPVAILFFIAKMLIKSRSLDYRVMYPQAAPPSAPGSSCTGLLGVRQALW